MMKNLAKLKILFLSVVLILGFNNLRAQCQASFTMVDNGGGSISFTNTSTVVPGVYYDWDFGDGTYDYVSDPTHTFVDGVYSVCLIISDSLGACSSTYCDSLQITGVDTTCSLVVDYVATDNGSGSYSFTPSAIGGAGPYIYYWQFGDGSVNTQANPTYDYFSNGVYDVCLTVTDINACTVSSCDSLMVTNSNGSMDSCGFDAGFTFADNGGGNYDFTNTSTGLGEVFIWNFGDGSTSSDYSPNHTFASNGVYVVVQGVTDSIGGCVEYFTSTITVTGVVSPTMCNAGFTIYTDSTYNGVYVINSSTGSNLTYFWDFGDGNTSTQAYPGYSYASAGPFLLCLTVSSDSSCTSTYCDSIGAGGIIFKSGGFNVNVQSPVITGIEDVKTESVSGLSVYPNPVIDNLTIDIELQRSSQVSVVVVDLLGNVVQEILNGELGSGVSKLYWNADGVSNGVYMLNVKTGNELITKKLVLNR